MIPLMLNSLFLQVFYSTVVNETAHLIAQWMSVGFAHGKNLFC